MRDGFGVLMNVKTIAGTVRWRLAPPGFVLSVAILALPCLAAPHITSAAPLAVHLYRDSVGMAHIYSAKEEGGFYGLGYATGEDRLIQVLTWYVAVRGELAATFGPKTPVLPGDSLELGGSGNAGPLEDAVANDLNARRFQLLEIARRNVPLLPAQYRRDLQAYVAGLNAYMRANPGKTPAWAPRMEPALPLALIHLMVPEQAQVCDARRASDRQSAVAAVPDPALQSSAGPLGGSNAWAIAGTHTADGHVIFESDSHGPIEAYGSLFHPYRIKAGALDITAIGPAGTALFLFGYTPHFAWGITEGPRYPADCYRISTEPGSPRHYRYDGKLRTISAEPYTIAVKGGAPVTGTFEYTRLNGVISPVMAREGNIAYAVSYASAERIGLGAGEYYHMATARNLTELQAALAQRDAYPANLLIGGADGTTMFIRPGRIPVRAPGVDATHTLDGNHSATAWRGIHSYKDALKLINPPQGYLANTNVSPDMMFPQSPLKPADYPAYFAFAPGQTNSRQQRLIELLDGRSNIRVDEARAIAMDETIPDARPWGAAIAAVANVRPDLVASLPSEPSSYLGDLESFDGAFAKESRGALDYYEMRTVLRDRHHDFADALDEAIQSGGGLSADQQNLLFKGILEAHQVLLEKYGRADFAWGEVHRVGRGGVDLPVGGGVSMNDASLRALQFRQDETGAKLRLTGGQRVPFLVHFTAAGPQAYAQALWGISNDPESIHFSDQAHLASDKILRPVPQSIPALIREQATETELLLSDNELGHR
jgi:acyl-homoserine-lactone acylase